MSWPQISNFYQEMFRVNSFKNCLPDFLSLVLLLSQQIGLFHPTLSMINDLLSSCQQLKIHAHTQIYIY